MTITKYKSNGNPGLCVHNPETNNLLCQFVDGVFETKDPKAIKILDNVAAQKDYHTNGELIPPALSRVDGKEPKVSELNHAPTAVGDMTIKELKEFAKSNAIEIPKKAKTRGDIFKTVSEALKADEEEDEEEEEAE